MRQNVCALIFGLLVCAGAVRAEQRVINAPPLKALPYKVWISNPPADCPLGESETLKGVAFTGGYARYTEADTWYPSWASDDCMYSGWTDGAVGQVQSWSGGKKAMTGYAKIVGSDPYDLKFEDACTVPASPRPYGGRYACGNLVYNGVWYYGTYCLMSLNGSIKGWAEVNDVLYNWGVLGPFVGWRISKDFGKTWTETPHTPDKPLLGEPNEMGGVIKFGVPHFVDFGKNMKHSPDGKAYMVCQGASQNDPNPRLGNLSWITADEIYLCRVKPSPETINDKSKYEFFGGRNAKGKDIWTRDIAAAKPILSWNNRCGCVTMTYNAKLKKYLMCITDGRTTTSAYNTFIVESDSITGPWKLVSFMRNFGVQGYFVNIPSKFISADGKSMWLCYSANFMAYGKGWHYRANPPGSGYGMVLQQIKLLGPDDQLSTGPLDRPENVARFATATASSAFGLTSADGVIDGFVDGWRPGDESREWAAVDSNNVSIKLEWEEGQLVDKVWLFDRINVLDDITAGMLEFSDGSSIHLDKWPKGPSAIMRKSEGIEVTFEPKKIKWLKFTAEKFGPKTTHAGLAEIAVFQSPRKK